jgi:hypothetical protein
VLEQRHFMGALSRAPPSGLRGWALPEVESQPTNLAVTDGYIISDAEALRMFVSLRLLCLFDLMI